MKGTKRFPLKKAIILCLSFLSVLILTGCSMLLEDSEPDDSVETFSVTSSMENLPNGIFIKDSEVYSRTYNEHKTYRDRYDEKNYLLGKDKRLIWYTDQLQKVPVLGEDAVIIYKSDSTIPEGFTLESFDHLCDSIGIKNISMNESGKFILSRNASDIHPMSSAMEVLGNYVGKGTVIIETINGVRLDGSMLNRAGSITGLEKGRTYRLGFYIGTRYYEADVIADTEVYASKQGFQLTTYETTKNGYIILNLPELMDPGLYDLNGSGTFWYEGVSAAIQEETETSAYVIEETEAETLPVGTYEYYEETEEETAEESVEAEEILIEDSE